MEPSSEFVPPILQREQALPHSDRHRFRAGLRGELRENGTDVKLHRMARDLSRAAIARLLVPSAIMSRILAGGQRAGPPAAIGVRSAATL